MAIKLGGIEFGIKVDTGTTVRRVNNVRNSVDELARSYASLSRAAAKATKATAKAESGGGGSRSSRARDRVTDPNLLPDRVIRNRIRMVDRIAKHEARKEADKIQSIKAEELARSRVFRNRMKLLARIHREEKKREADSVRAIQREEALRQRATRRILANIRRVRAARARDERANSSDFGAGAAGGLTTFLGALGAARVADHIRDFTLLAARVENLDTVMRNTATTANFAAGELTLVENRIRKLGITTRVTREIMARFAQNELDVADAATVSRIAQDAAVVAGINSSDAAERLAVAIQRLDTRMLRNLGIIVNLRNEYQRYGLATGRVETSLTATEKQQIVFDAVVRRATALAGNYESALEDVFKQFTSLDRKIEEAQRTIGSNFIPIMEISVKTLDRFFDGLTHSSSAMQVWVATSLSVVTASTAVAVAIGGVALALRGLQAAGVASVLSPLVAGLIAASAVAAGLVSLFSSITSQTRKAREERDKLIQSDASALVQLRSSLDEIQRLGDITERTTMEQQLLNSKMEETISLLGDDKFAADFLKENRDSAESFAAALLTVRKELAQTNETYLSNLKKRGATLSKLLKDLNENERQIVESNPGRQSVFERSIRLRDIKDLRKKVLSELSDTATEIESIRRTLNNKTIRVIEDQVKATETAYTLAQQVERTLSDERVKLLKGTNAVTLREMQKYLRRLSFDIATEESIEKLRLLKRQEAFAKFKKLMSKENADIDKLLQQQNATLLNIDQDAADQTVQAKRARDAVTEMFDLTRLKIESVESATKALDLSLRRQAIGVSSSLVKAYEDLAKSQEMGRAAQETARQEADKLARSESDLSEKYSTASDEERERIVKNVIEIRKARKLFARGQASDLAALEVRQRQLRKTIEDEKKEGLKDFEKSLGDDPVEDIKKISVELRALTMELSLTSEGISGSLVKQLVAASSESDEASSKIREVADEVDKLRERLSKLRDGAASDDPVEREFSKEAIKIVESRIQQLESLRDKSRDVQLRKERKLQDQLFEIREDAAKKHGDLLEKQTKAIEDQAQQSSRALVGSIKDLRAAFATIQDQTASTESFIFSKRVGLFGQRFLGEKDLFNALGQFEGALKGAGTGDQIGSILSLAESQFRMMSAQLQNSGVDSSAFDQQARSVFPRLFAIAEGRQREIEEKRLELQTQISQLDMLARIHMEVQKQTEIYRAGGRADFSGAANAARTRTAPGSVRLPTGFEFAPTTPFDLGLGKRFAGVVSRSDQFRESVNDLGRSMVRSLTELDSQMDQQSKDIKQTAADLDVLRRRLGDREKSSNRALQGRGL